MYNIYPTKNLFSISSALTDCNLLICSLTSVAPSKNIEVVQCFIGLLQLSLK